MVHALISQSVRNLADWKKRFDEHEPFRNASGVRILNVFTQADAPNRVLLLGEADSPEKFRDFLKSDNVVKNMQAAGVVSEPQVTFLNRVDGKQT